MNEVSSFVGIIVFFGIYTIIRLSTLESKLDRILKLLEKPNDDDQ